MIQILLDIQKASGGNYLPEECIKEVAEKLGAPLSKVCEVVTFYSMFNKEPKGKYIIEVYKSVPCHATGSNNVAKMFEDALEINIGEVAPDGLFSLQYSSCFSACHISPAVKIAGKVYGNLTDKVIKEIIEEYHRL